MATPLNVADLGPYTIKAFLNFSSFTGYTSENPVRSSIILLSITSHLPLVSMAHSYSLWDALILICVLLLG